VSLKANCAFAGAAINNAPLNASQAATRNPQARDNGRAHGRLFGDGVSEARLRGDKVFIGNPLKKAVVEDAKALLKQTANPMRSSVMMRRRIADRYANIDRTKVSPFLARLSRCALANTARIMPQPQAIVKMHLQGREDARIIMCDGWM
jgi:hypothetical protein